MSALQGCRGVAVGVLSSVLSPAVLPCSGHLRRSRMAKLPIWDQDKWRGELPLRYVDLESTFSVTGISCKQR